MRRRILAVLSVGLLVVAAVPTARAEIDAEQAKAAIDRAVKYLKNRQADNGSWPDYGTGQQPGGVTSLCTLALLNAGVPADDPSVQKALSYLRRLELPKGTYAAALQIMAFAAGEPKKDLLFIRRNARWLEETQIVTGQTAGSWSYPSGRGDNSNTQFALLGLHEAERLGVQINIKTWRLAHEYWTKPGSQNPDGSWGYLPGAPGSGSMTCAGIASVIITAGALSKGDAEFVGGRIKCCGQQLPNDAVDRGLEWMGRNFSVHANPGTAGGSWTYYYLYGLERTGRMTARRFIGEHDWYRLGVKKLVDDQDGLTGTFRGAGHAEADANVGTSLALLFLAKGRRPILVAKLKHGPGDDWNHHRSDLANLTAYVESKWKRDMTWQVIDPAAATVEDLLQSPVLFINGKEAPEFNDEQKHSLRDYIDRGGFIFAEACCDGTGFKDGFKKLMHEVFPEPEYDLKAIRPEHPIWRTEEELSPLEAERYNGKLFGIDVGCRTSVVLLTEDVSCLWELARSGREQHFPPNVQRQIKGAETMGINVLAYATNRELKYKYDTFQTPEEVAKLDPFDRGKLYVAKIKHPGGCNAAPTALINLLTVAGEKLKIRVSTEPREATLSDPTLFNYHLVFMHGRHNFRLTEAERKQLRKNLESGGMLFADAICSSPDFAAAFRRELKLTFTEYPFERIPAAHPIFTPDFGGDDLSVVSRRQLERGQGPIKTEVRQGEPYLEGIKIRDHYAVIFSRYDISCALEKHESLECEGYIRADAARIGMNVIFYSLHD